MNPTSMKKQARFSAPTAGPGLYEFTADAADFVKGRGDGLLTLFCQHTSCSLLVQENADPDVQADLTEFFRRIAPSLTDASMSWVRHRTEGPDDMPAHIRAALTQVSLSIPVTGGRLALGTWQGIYLFEHREQRHTRHVVAHFSA